MTQQAHCLPPCCPLPPADAVLYGCLAFIRGAPVIHEKLRHKLESHPSLVAYLDRIAAGYFAVGVPSVTDDGGIHWSHWESAGSSKQEERWGGGMGGHAGLLVFRHEGW